MTDYYHSFTMLWHAIIGHVDFVYLHIIASGLEICDNSLNGFPIVEAKDAFYILGYEL